MTTQDSTITASSTESTSTASSSTASSSEASTVECWQLLGERGLGRLATVNRGRVDIFPVNYLVHDHAILFRSAPGSKLVDITRSPDVAFEVDGTDARFHWSVVVHGTAERLGSESDIYESGIMSLVTWSPTDKFNFVRITPTEITGRRFDRRTFRLADEVGVYGALVAAPGLTGPSPWPAVAPDPAPVPSPAP